MRQVMCEAPAAERAALEATLSPWERSLNEETQALLRERPDLRRFYREMDPRVRDLLTRCASPCIPETATAAEVTRIHGAEGAGRADRSAGARPARPLGRPGVTVLRAPLQRARRPPQRAPTTPGEHYVPMGRPVGPVFQPDGSVISDVQRVFVWRRADGSVKTGSVRISPPGTQ